MFAFRVFDVLVLVRNARKVGAFMGKLLQAVTGGVILVASIFVCVPTTAGANGADAALVMDVNRGTVSFDVDTNIPAVRVHGKSESVTARAQLISGPEGLVLAQMTASVPVQSLKTGIALRDEHMRKYVFTTHDGQTPDVRFSGERAECLKTGSERRSTCTVIGTLVIRDIARPFTMVLSVNEEHGNLRASGDGIVKLSAYGIDQPSQLGVRTTDEVKLKLELSARRPAEQVALNSR
jgi:polyisoprenoid-binding protein YceI